MPDPAPAARERELHLTLPALAEKVVIARHAVDRLAEAAGLDRGTRASVALAVSEACANVVVHAYTAADVPGTLSVDARGVAGRLSVVVGDRGTGMAPRSDSPGIGLGLPLMASLCSTLEVRERRGGGTEVVMLFEGAMAHAGEQWAQAG